MCIRDRALSDHATFDNIKSIYGIGEKDVKKLMRENLKSRSYKSWRKRVREFSDRRLRDVIITRQTRWYSILSSSDKYDPQQLQVDENLLRKFYKDNGYADVEIKPAVAQLDREKDGFNIIFTVDEGEEYKYGKISIVSNIAEIDTNSILKELKIEQGDVYSASKIESNINIITK